MRKSKFRVWDVTNKKWGDPEQLECDRKGNLSYFDIDIDCGSHTATEKVIIQQYTGLNDINNVPIYEGDILNSTYFGAVEYNENRARFEVNLTGSAVYGLDELCEDGMVPIIVGNIFNV